MHEWLLDTLNWVISKTSDQVLSQFHYFTFFEQIRSLNGQLNDRKLFKNQEKHAISVTHTNHISNEFIFLYLCINNVGDSVVLLKEVRDQLPLFTM